jgi:hypothetical protein
MEETNNTNECDMQHGREVTDKNPNSPTTSQKSIPSTTKNRTNGMDMRNASVGGSHNGGDKEPPRKSLENYHIAYTSIKRK